MSGNLHLVREHLVGDCKEDSSSEHDGHWGQTRWSRILAAHTQNPTRRRSALGDIAKQYWHPVYWYFRRKGHTADEAEDLTQNFFTDIVLGKDLVSKATPGKDGRKNRFRGFLCKALRNYRISQHRRQQAKKRQHEKNVVSLEGFGSNIPKPVCRETATPEDVFNYVWASNVWQQVLSEVRNECSQSGQVTHWEIFSERMIAPIQKNTKPPTLEELAARHGLSGADSVSGRVTTVKRKFRAALRQYMRQFVDSDDHVDDEINDLMKILTSGSPRVE